MTNTNTSAAEAMREACAKYFDRLAEESSAEAAANEQAQDLAYADIARQAAQDYRDHAASIRALPIPSAPEQEAPKVAEGCDFPPGQLFRAHKDDPSNKHSAWYVVLPGGSSVALNHNADDAVDEARARWIAGACNAALLAVAPSPEPAKCCRQSPCVRPGVGPCDMPAAPRAEQPFAHETATRRNGLPQRV